MWSMEWGSQVIAEKEKCAICIATHCYGHALKLAQKNMRQEMVRDVAFWLKL